MLIQKGVRFLDITFLKDIKMFAIGCFYNVIVILFSFIVLYVFPAFLCWCIYRTSKVGFHLSVIFFVTKLDIGLATWQECVWPAISDTHLHSIQTHRSISGARICFVFIDSRQILQSFRLHPNCCHLSRPLADGVCHQKVVGHHSI